MIRARIAYEVAQLEINKAKAGELPTVDAVATLGANYASGSSNQIIPGTTRTGSIGVELNWPLYTGGSVQNRIKETVSLEQRSREEFENARRTVAQNTRVAFWGVQSGEALVKALEAAESLSRLSLEAAAGLPRRRARQHRCAECADAAVPDPARPVEGPLRRARQQPAPAQGLGLDSRRTTCWP